MGSHTCAIGWVSWSVYYSDIFWLHVFWDHICSTWVQVNTFITKNDVQIIPLNSLTWSSNASLIYLEVVTKYFKRREINRDQYGDLSLYLPPPSPRSWKLETLRTREEKFLFTTILQNTTWLKSDKIYTRQWTALAPSIFSTIEGDIWHYFKRSLWNLKKTGHQLSIFPHAISSRWTFV